MTNRWQAATTFLRHISSWNYAALMKQLMAKNLSSPRFAISPPFPANFLSRSPLLIIFSPRLEIPSKIEWLNYLNISSMRTYSLDLCSGAVHTIKSREQRSSQLKNRVQSCVLFIFSEKWWIIIFMLVTFFQVRRRRRWRSQERDTCFVVELHEMTLISSQLNGTCC